MIESILVHDNRTGFFTLHAGVVWAESDLHGIHGWRTLVPYCSNGVFEPRPSVVIRDKATAERIAKAVRDAETWLEARESIEAIVDKKFFRYEHD